MYLGSKQAAGVPQTRETSKSTSAPFKVTPSYGNSEVDDNILGEA